LATWNVEWRIVSLPKGGVDFDTFFGNVSTKYYQKKLKENCGFSQFSVKRNVKKNAITGCLRLC
jgi:hypothetical protein